MNIKEYISSGIVESYVLGLAEKEDRAEFEKLCASHAELRDARDAFETSLEQNAILNAVQPPENLKANIFAALVSEAGSRPSPSPVIPINRSGDFDRNIETIGKKRTLLPYLAAASVILLLVSTALNFYFYSQFKSYSDKYAGLLSEQQRFAALNKDLSETVAILKDPDLAVIKLPGVPAGPEPASMAVVRWNKRSKDVYVDVDSMPKPAAGKQYQLWAIVDGKPVNAGLIAADTTNPAEKLGSIPRAEAFAITLENAGGSATPTMTQLYVYGNVNTERPG